MPLVPNFTIQLKAKMEIKGQILTSRGVIKGSVRIEGEKITAIRRAGRVPPLFILPGLIDLHVNGVGNCDLTRNPEKSLPALSLEMARRGVTSFLPALISAPVSKLIMTLPEMARSLKNRLPGARPLGVHLEGPFLNPKRRGVHPRSALETISATKIERLLKAGGGAIKMMTVAPELDRDYKTLRQLQRHGIIAAMGHSAATYEEGIASIRKGYSYATHLFNAMNPWHHRHPGLAGAILDSPDVIAELICDGVHVAAPALEMALRLKGPSRTVLASDELVGRPPFAFARQTLRRHQRHWLTPSGRVIAGSALSLLEGLRQWAQKSKRNWLELIPLATMNPSRVCGTSRKTGTVEPGKRADLIVVTPQLKLLKTFVGGRVVFERR